MSSIIKLSSTFLNLFVKNSTLYSMHSECFIHFNCQRNTQNISSLSKSNFKWSVMYLQKHGHFLHPKQFSDQEKCGLVWTNSTLIKWEITDLDLLQIEKYTLADRWILKFFLNCLNACFFGNLTTTGKRESRGEREKRSWKVLKKHIMNVNYSSNTGLCFFWANIINIFVW